MSKNLASKAVHGLKWGSAATIANALMQIGYTSVMARLLVPEAFGLVAISSVILRFGSYFANLGLNKAIIQKEVLEEEHIRAGFTSSFLLGALFTFLVWVLAPVAVQFFGNPEVAPIVRVMSVSFLIHGLSATSVSLLERHMRFKEVSIIETLSYILAYMGVGILLAYLDFGVWSLVYATLTQAVLQALGSYVLVRHSLLFLFRWAPYKPLFSYGSRMSVSSFIEFISQELPTILIGRMLGTHQLGLYNRAYMLVNLPMYMLTRTFTKVVFPSFSQMQHDVEKLGQVYLSSITLLASLVIPACLGLLVAAPEIVLLLLGPQWTDSIPVLQVLSLAIPLGFVTMFAGIVCDAKAVLNAKILLNLAFIVLLAGFFFLLQGYGLVGFALAILLGELVRIVLYQYIMHKVLYLSYRRQLSIYLPGIVNGILVALGIYLLSSVMRSADLPLWLVLGAQVSTGAVLLLILSLLFPHKLLRAELLGILVRAGLNSSSNKPYHRVIDKYKHYILKQA